MPERSVKSGSARVPHPTVAERAATGRAARKRMRRTAHGEWTPAADRRSPVEQLIAQEVTRVPNLVAIRHARMLVSPFTFYRGAAAVMAADLAAGPETGLWVQGCGDAHLLNFGGFATTERSMSFSINDFDETNPAPFEWDVKRLAASVEIAARERGFDATTSRAAVRSCARTYRRMMLQFAELGNLDVWYLHLDAAEIQRRWRNRVSDTEAARVAKNVAKARTKDSVKAFAKLTHVVDGRPRIVNDPPLITPIETLVPGVAFDDIRDWVTDQFRTYRRSLEFERRLLLEQYELVDIAHKVVGVGSVGTRCWVVLLIGRDEHDPLFLQVKEAEASVLEAHTVKNRAANHGQRVVQGQRMLQESSDVLLGWTRTTGFDGTDRDFYVRQLWDWKYSADIESMDPDTLRVYAEICGWSLAQAHARSGDRVAIAAYLGTSASFDHAIADFAAVYADRNDRDYETMQLAAAAGEVTLPPERA